MTETESNVDREDNEVVSAVDRVHDAIQSLPAKLTPATPAQFDLTAVAQSTHVRMRTGYLIMSPTAAGLVTLNIGQRAYPFTFAAGVLVPVVLPFVKIVDRGVDVWIVPAAGVVTAYLIYTPDR